MGEFILETAEPGDQALSSRLVSETQLPNALPAERPAFLLAYDPSSQSAQQARVKVMRWLKNPRPTFAEAWAKKYGIEIVRLPENEWQTQIQALIQDRDRTTVLFAFGSGRRSKKAAPEAPRDQKSQLALVNARRDRVLAIGEWYTAAQVATSVNGQVAASNPSQFASNLRRQHRLLGVRYQGEYLHPAFQFDPGSGVLSDQVATLLAILPKESSGWAAALWCFQPTPWLNNRRPADVFGAEPERVLEAAKKTFEKSDANW